MRADEGRILTVPNLVTLVRLSCIPVFLWFLLNEGRRDWEWAALFLGAIGATDWVDGFLARRLHQVSTVGKVLDPLADRLLLAVAAVSVIVVGAIPLWVAVVALSREALVVAGFVLVAAAGGRRMDVILSGKAGTLGLMFAIPLFLAGHSTVPWHYTAEVLAWIFAIPALVLGWYSAVRYARQARGALSGDRARLVGKNATSSSEVSR